MSKTIARIEIGRVGVNPGDVVINDTTSTYSQVVAAGYITPSEVNTYSISPLDVITVNLGNNTNGFFNVSISGGVCTLSGVNNAAPITTVAGRIATFSNTTGSLESVTGTATHLGDIILGDATQSGAFVSKYGQAASGYSRWAHAPTTGDFHVIYTNADVGQNVTMTTPDVGGAAGSFLVKLSTDTLVAGNLLKVKAAAGTVQDSGIALRYVAVPFAGSGTTVTYAFAGVTAASIATASIFASTNAVEIQKVTCGAADVTILFSGDPGANTVVNVIAIN